MRRCGGVEGEEVWREGGGRVEGGWWREEEGAERGPAQVHLGVAERRRQPAARRVAPVAHAQPQQPAAVAESVAQLHHLVASHRIA